MNYTEVKRYLVYKDKLDIDEFNISDPKSMDGVLFNFLEHSWIAGLADAPKLICSIFDTAHYIVTLIHLEAHPLLHIASYLDKADHVGADGPHFVHTHHLELRAATMGLVCNYLRVLSPEHLDVKAFLRAVHDQIEGSEPSTGARLSVHMVGAFKEPYDIFYEITHLPDIQSRTLLREDFRPRPIDEALEESNYEDICNNIAYIKERIKELPEDRQRKAVDILFVRTQNTGEADLKGSMANAAQYIRETMGNIFSTFGYNHFPSELIASPDEAEDCVEESDRVIVDEEPYNEIAKLHARIQEPDNKVKGVQQREDNAPADPQEVERWMSEAERVKRMHEEMIVELLKPIFFNDEVETKKFMAKIADQSDVEVTALVRDGVEKHIISSKSKKRPLWRILHAAKYYTSSESNWNDQLK